MPSEVTVIFPHKNLEYLRSFLKLCIAAHWSPNIYLQTWLLTCTLVLYFWGVPFIFLILTCLFSPKSGTLLSFLSQFPLLSLETSSFIYFSLFSRSVLSLHFIMTFFEMCIVMSFYFPHSFSLHVFQHCLALPLVPSHHWTTHIVSLLRLIFLLTASVRSLSVQKFAIFVCYLLAYS